MLRNVYAGGRYRVALVLAAVLSIAVSGCGLGSGETGDWSVGNEDVEDSIGDDYDSGDEEPGFGDPEIQAMAEDDPYDDPFEKDGELEGASSIFVRIVWGNLVFDPDETEWRDYSGEIALDAGTLIVVRTIAFENHDFQIEDREDPQRVAWSSRTLPHYDGLLLQVVPGADTEENELHVTVGPYSADIPVADLSSMLRIDPAGLGDDHVAIAARASEGGESDGFIAGRWRNLPEKVGGVCKVKRETADGTLLGHERMRYASTGEGEGEIRGKSIDTYGNFEDLLKGDYTRLTEDPLTGEFAIDRLDEDGNVIGESVGVFMRNDGEALGFAMGHWSLF